MGELTMEEWCDLLRKEIQKMKVDVANMHDHSDFDADDMCLAEGNVPSSQKANMHANITLVFRSLEDARMRLGKVMQAKQGGVSILDK